MASYILLMQSGPDQTEQGLHALATAENLIAEGHRITQVFFYGPAVIFGNQFLSFPSSLDDLQQRWRQLSHAHDVPLVVCSTVGAQYGVEALPPPQGNLAAGFQAGGLAEFVATLANTEQLLQF
ncbi:MAG: DsrE family protein [Idiomarina sp.]|nr:DsrE family protein [Idiomarina sp.]